ncbi:MAG: hypothetical protein ACR2OF_00945 [Hyphomicrobium sp.]
MTLEQKKLREILSTVLNKRAGEVSISPAWLATEAMIYIDPDRISPSLVYQAAHLQLRQLGRDLCRKQYTEAIEGDPQHRLFPDLQARYPTCRSASEDDPEYVKLEHLTQEDVDYNVARLRAEASAKMAHARALEAWGREQFGQQSA